MTARLEMKNKEKKAECDLFISWQASQNYFKIWLPGMKSTSIMY